MADIVERLQLAAREDKKTDGALHQDAVAEIEQLRDKNKELQTKLERYYQMGEPEF